jgi:hypothetical protein
MMCDLWGQCKAGGIERDAVSSFVYIVVKSCSLFCDTFSVTYSISARNGNLEVLVYFLKAKQDYTMGKMEKKYNWI